jgi:uncharacterized protein (DUF1330 family)
MAKGYVIFTESIKDEAGMGAYGSKAAPTMMEHGGTPLVVHDEPEVLEGDWHGSRTVILEFDSVDAARAWYHSPAYQDAIPLRQAAAETNVVIVEGFALPS